MSDQTTPRTYRDILTPVVGADALREAEARVYDRPANSEALGLYQCADGYCALGVMYRTTHPEASFVLQFPMPSQIVSWRDNCQANAAAQTVANANDAGDLATPGSLTALLDSEVTR